MKPSFFSISSFNSGIRTDLPSLNIGERLKITSIFNSLGKDRIVNFEGILISKRNSGNINYSIKILREYSKIVVTKLFFYNDPSIVKILKINNPFVEKFRRAKLNYLERKLSKKKA